MGEGEDEMEEEDEEEMEEEDEQEVRRRKGEGGEVKKDGDRYRRGGVDMMQSAAFESMDLHKSMENSHRDEEYARAYVANSAKFNQQWLERESARSLIPTTFPDEIRPKENLRWKKGGSRRRAYTGCEAAEADEANQRRARCRDSIEQGRRRRYDKLRESDENESVISDGKNPRYKQIDATRLTYDVVDLTEDAVIVSDDDDLHYVDTQPIPDPSTSLTLPSNDNDASSTSPDSFEDIDEVLTKHSQKVSSQTAPSLYNLNQNLRLSQLPANSSATTRRSRGVAKKSKALLELESQQKAEQADNRLGPKRRSRRQL